MTYSVLKGEDMKLSARLMVLTGLFATAIDGAIGHHMAAWLVSKRALALESLLNWQVPSVASGLRNSDRVSRYQLSIDGFAARSARHRSRSAPCWQALVG